MVRWLGAILVAAGASWSGFRAAADLKGRCRALTEMAEGLELLALELEWEAVPLLRLLERAAAAGKGSARTLFQESVQVLERRNSAPFSSSWRQLSEARVELGEEGRQCLLSLGNVLGRCDSREQQRALSTTAKRLRELARRAEEDYRQQGKVYQTLGLSGGAFLIILLL